MSSPQIVPDPSATREDVPSVGGPNQQEVFMSTSTDTRVAGLDAKLEWLSARIDSLEIGPIRPGR